MRSKGAVVIIRYGTVSHASFSLAKNIAVRATKEGMTGRDSDGFQIRGNLKTLISPK